jgi:general secretion pathway protein N
MAGREMMRMITVGVVLLALSIHGASALTSAASNDALDADLRDDAQTAAASAVASAPIPAAAPRPAVLPSAAPASEPTLSANPLWAIPLTQLSSTRDRPIFSPSRRPVPAAVAAESVVAKVAPPPRKPEPPPLALLGTIASDDEGFAIFLDQSTKAALRLKIGEDYQGWKLLMIQGRDVTMARDKQVAVLSLPQPGAGSASGGTRLLSASAVTLPSAMPPPSRVNERVR